MPRGVYERKPRQPKAAKAAKPEKIKKVKADKPVKAPKPVKESKIKTPKVPKVKVPKEPKPPKVPRLPKTAGRIARKVTPIEIVPQRSLGYQSELIKERFQIFQSAVGKLFNIYDHFAIARDGLPGDHIRDMNDEIVLFDSVEDARKFLTHS